MIYRKLGKTGIDVGVVGLGAEYLELEPENTVVSVVHEAIDNDVNYIDLFMASPGVRDNFGKALQNKRQKVIIAGHLGSVMRDGQYCRSRDGIECLSYYEDLLRRLKTDYIDVLMLHFIQSQDDYEQVFHSGGLLELALKIKKQGKARFLGVSGHNVPTALQAVNSGYIDVLMFPVNPAFDTLPEEMLPGVSLKEILDRQAPSAAGDTMPARRALYHACAAQNVALVAMKPYAAGVLFRENPSSIVLTPVQCLSYALAQPAVSTAVPGCKNVAELQAALAFLEAPDEEKDFSAIHSNPMWKLKGSCMYCNHCLPCPVSIDIGTLTKITDTAGLAMSSDVAAAYEALPVKASACTECGACMERCPFGVDVIASMNRAVEIFGK
ncbi:MAG: aldo/keto reductase [Dehalococcoidales bacterium]|nr:aldo/keto reductase [Dehalococcoidales bacterium]